MTNPASPAGAPTPLRTCENCRAALQGGYCHLCGQSEQSPVRHAGHALEEVFESFWHLDGRIFRTLRGLWIPGRVANQYLSGHRVRYVAPMRLFVILTALTFFVAQFLVDPAGAPGRTGGGSDTVVVIAQIQQAQSVAEVERIRDGLRAELAAARDQLPPLLPGLDAGMISAGAAADQAAAARIRELRGAGGGDSTGPAPAMTGSPDLQGPAAGGATDWGHPESLERLNRNLQQLANDPRGFLRALLGAAPMTLFVTVPLFALMLKVAYVFKRRLYLEHLTVALYSHAWLMLVLLLYFASVLAGGWLLPRAAWVAAPLGWLQGLLLVLMPLYLLWMQKRVYRQSWPVTLFKYGVIGAAYLLLVMVATFAVSVYVMVTM